MHALLTEKHGGGKERQGDDREREWEREGKAGVSCQAPVPGLVVLLALLQGRKLAWVE